MVTLNHGSSIVKPKSPMGLYCLLIPVALISAGYYVAGAVALRETFFNASHYARAPFDTGMDSQTLTDLEKEAKSAGLSAGDLLITVNGAPFTGEAQLEDLWRRAKPGEVARFGVRTRSGQTPEAKLRLAPREGPNWNLGGLIAFLAPILGVPLLGLVVGYWVVAARPHDLNAWLVLILLAFPETAFGNLKWNFWPAPWYIIFGFWNLSVQTFAFLALVLLGFYFPERWRVDRRWPWLKWLIVSAVAAWFVIYLWLEICGFYNVPALRKLSFFLDSVNFAAGALEAACVVLFLVALFDKLRSASTPDARRRLRVLAVGSALSLGPLVLIFAIAPLFGQNPHAGNWFMGVVPFIVLFPLTLAYVLIVQRAMDLRILLRLGTKYLLARATLVMVEIGVAIFVIVYFLVPMLERKGHPAINAVLVTAGAALLFRVFFMRNSLGTRAQRWLDRKFFREAYNSELVLSELSEEARKLTDKQTLIETVLRRISDVLHVQQMAVWLRGSNVFQLQQAMGIEGIDFAGPVMLKEESATVQNLLRTNRPATLYQDRPEDWFESAGADERAVLREVNAELLLPLPGRETLLGVMALGPKKSEEPYTPTDLRVLQSVAAQTGLTLEVADLVQSLANEAAQRERVRREIEIAREVQQRLFPQRIPEMPGVSLAGTCRPALEVGGDYYDFIELEDGRLGLAVGDVSGKGISAALIMASLRASLRGLTLDGPGNLARMMEKVNRLVYESSSTNRYATFFFAIYDPIARDLHFVNAGHNAPILMRGASGEVRRLEAGGLVVGLLPVAVYEAQTIRLEPGDLLIGYTDGISEAMTADEEEWGEERLIASVQSNAASAAEVIEAIFHSADEFTAGAEQHDDMTLLIMKIAARRMAESDGST